jgi:chitinase
LILRGGVNEKLTSRNKRLLISYDTQAIAIQKANYINQKNLGGAMWWELDADKEESTGGALVRTVKEALGGLEWRENELGYPGSSTFSFLTMIGG